MEPARRASIPDQPVDGTVTAQGDTGYEPGGEIARLQADLARRLASMPASGLGAHVGDQAEATVRRLSVAAGYGALTMGYVIAAAVIYWA